MVQTNGTAAAPSYTFGSNSDMGMYRATASEIGFASAGIRRMGIAAGQIFSAGSGGAAAPAWSFDDNTNMGMYRVGSNVLGFATAGVERMNIDSVGMTALARVFFRNASDTSGFRLSYATQAGVNRWQWIFEASNTGIPFHLRLNRFNSSGVFAGLPIAFDPDTGQITMGELPTTNPGGTGILWKSGGFIAIT